VKTPGPQKMSCELSHYDGAYVLGALSPAERSEFQAHLAGCDECSRAVQELAGLPGLLGRVPADVLESPGEEPLPATLLPALLRETRRTRRRRTRMFIAAAAAAAVVIAGGSVAVGLALGDEGGSTATTVPSVPTGRTMELVGPDVMSASLALTSVPWGTRLDLSCSYPPPKEASSGPSPWTYTMFVTTDDGQVEQVATWRALPGETMQLAAATAANREDIRSVEIRLMTGEPLLRLEA